MTAAPALDVRGLSVSYGGRPAIWDVDAEFPAGALSAIVGPNGAGKSTLLKAVLGLVSVEAGVVTIAGAPAGRAHRRLAYVPQRDAVDWDFPITVREVVEMGRYPSTGWMRRLRDVDHEAVAAALDRVGMAPFAGRQIDELSGGQRQRVFLARALAQAAEVLLLDEPFTGIDARTEVDLLELLQNLRDEGRSIILVHHDIRTVRAWFDWALLLNVRTVACGPVADALDAAALRRAYGVAAAAPTPGDEPAWVG